ncbi:MAG: TonB-dependent receptor [Saprospiraceae bacterium]
MPAKQAPPITPNTDDTPGSITGVVRDAENGDLLPAVTIQLYNNTSGAVTDLNGSFRIAGLPAGNYTISAIYLGYQNAVLENVAVLAGQCSQVKFLLAPASLTVGEVVVTASLRSQAVKLAPASIGVITNKQLEERNITTFDQAFDEMPGVVVTRSSGANVQAFSIRGASEVAGGGIGNRVLLLIDGRPALSPESGGALWNLVPMGSIERIEVVRGAYSSLYGSSAMGGVVNVITRNPGPEPETRVHIGYGAYDRAPRSTGYQRFNDFKTAVFSQSRQLGKFSYLLDGSWKTDDGHKEKAGFDLLNFYAKTAWQFNDNHRLQLSANVNRIYNDTPASWLSRREAYQVAPHRVDDYQDRRELNADLYYLATPTNRLKYATRLYHYANVSTFSFNDDPGNDSTNVNTGKQVIDESRVRTYRLGSNTQVDFFTASGHCLLAGLDLRYDYVLGEPDTVLYGEHRALSAGVFVQDEVAVTKKLTATAGLRFDFYRILGQVESTNLSPKLALVYQLRPGFSLRLLLAQAFRDPPVAERFIKFEQGGGLRFLPNPELKAERLILSAEFGTKFNPFPGASFDIALFYNRYNNLISFRQLSNPFEPLLYQVVNLKAARMQGLEIYYRQQLGKSVSANISYTFLDARDISEGRVNDALAYKVRHTLGLGATVVFGSLTMHANCRYRSRVEEVFIYPGSEPGAVFVANTKISYQLPGGKNSLFVAVNNLGNAQYEELERYRMPGRSFAVGFNARF